MSVGCSEATIVKEEYEILEYDVDLKEALATEGPFDEPRSKCGEVFLSQRGGDFIFVCAQCQQTFSEFHNFGEHIRDEHPIFDIETILPVDGDKPPPKLEPSDQHTSDFGLHGGEPSEDMAKMEVIEDDAHCKDDDHPEESHSGTSKENCRTFSCKSCDSTFFEFESYRKHYTSEHPDMIEIDADLGNISEQTPVPSETCKYCSKTFDDIETYHRHIENAHPNKQYTCPYCPKSFTRRLERNYHVNSHEGRKPHMCPHCASSFARRCSLNEHVKFIHTNIKLQFSCRFCDKKFKRNTKLRRHEQIHTVERTQKTVDCNECDMKFKNKSHLRNHMRIHYKCSHCDKAFYSSTLLEEHLLMLRNEQTWVCKYCSKTFDDEGTYHSHVESNHFNKLYICPYCPKSFRRSYEKNIHVDTHEGRKPHKCPHCPSAFSRRNSLNEHVRFIHTTSSLEFTCRFCDKKFKRKYQVTRHEEIHTVERTVECNECDMKFRNKRQLHNHMLKHDMAQKNYKCAHCDSAFLCSTRLEEHLLTHRNEQESLSSGKNSHVDTHDCEKAHKCPHCPSIFTRRDCLKNHVRFIHTDISPQFTCRFCDKKFKRKSELKRHEEIHTTERTLGCNDCDMKFRNKRQLHNHMLKHYMTQKNYKCTHCEEAFLCSTLLEEHLLTHRDERPFNANIEAHIETKGKNLSQSVHEDNFPRPKSEHLDGAEADS